MPLGISSFGNPNLFSSVTSSTFLLLLLHSFGWPWANVCFVCKIANLARMQLRKKQGNRNIDCSRRNQKMTGKREARKEPKLQRQQGNLDRRQTQNSFTITNNALLYIFLHFFSSLSHRFYIFIVSVTKLPDNARPRGLKLRRGKDLFKNEEWKEAKEETNEGKVSHSGKKGSTHKKERKITFN